MSRFEFKNGILWFSLSLILLLLTGFLGLLMRFSQSGYLSLEAKTFYTILTLHGQANAVIFFLAALALSRALLSLYLDLREWLTIFSTILMLAGLLGAAFTVFLGELSYGWYFLYPIPYFESPAIYRILWVLYVILIGLGILISVLDIILSSSKKYGFSNSLGWHYIAGVEGPDIPPVVLISMASSIVAIFAVLAGALLLLGFLAQDTGLISGLDPLGAKNLTFMFGHTIVNLAMFFTIACVYEVMPKYSGKAWKSSWIVAIAWNLAIIYVMLAMFHHLYMDFIQPLPLQFIGQAFSYIASIPAIVVTIIGALGQIYYYIAKTSYFSMIPLFIFFGIISWLIGGAAAIIDATIPVNYRFHNTLWVPAHFHTYYAYGVVIMLIAIAWSFFEEKGIVLQNRIWRTIVTLLTLGWSLHLASFYVGGIQGVPRRYASYTELPGDLPDIGRELAIVSIIGILIYAVGYLPLLYYTLKASIKVLRGG